MLITKTPFRVSFCGGGSDMADFMKNIVDVFSVHLLISIVIYLFIHILMRSRHC